MDKKSIHKTVFYIGLVIFLTSIILGFSGINNWMFLIAIGGWLVFDYLASLKKKETTFQLLLKDKKKFFSVYLMLIFYGGTAEIVGRYILGWWIYPQVTSIPHEMLILLITYPIGSMFAREAFQTVNAHIKSYSTAVIITTLVNIVIWEIPNLFSYDWLYTVPYLEELTIFNHLNILIFLTWPLLIIFPLIVYDIVLKKP